ncbi:hypothetical protein [Yunchengibacter salinarum]|uniref:hypothetical protein n=1 Tax=Yunchengibacter salinarum TaxID=3133399 RepID=UPI0035B59E24
MTAPHIVYDTQTGLIQRQILADPETVTLNLADDEAALVGTASPGADYVDLADPPVIRPRRVVDLMPDRRAFVADGNDQVVFANLPDPCRLVVDGVQKTITGGSFAFTTDRVGLHRVLIDQPPFERHFWLLDAVTP